MEVESSLADSGGVSSHDPNYEREREMRKNAVVLRLFKEGKITDEQVSLYFTHQVPKNRKRKILTTIVNRPEAGAGRKLRNKSNPIDSGISSSNETAAVTDGEHEDAVVARNSINLMESNSGSSSRFHIAYASKECKKAVDLRIFNKGVGAKKQYTLNEKATALFQLEEMGMGYIEKIAESIGAPITTIRQWNIPSNKSKILNDWQLALDEYGNEAVARDRKRFRRMKGAVGEEAGGMTLEDALVSSGSSSSSSSAAVGTALAASSVSAPSSADVLNSS